MGFFHDYIGMCRGEHERLRRLLSRWREGADLTVAPVLPLQPPPEKPFELSRLLLKIRGALPDVETPLKPPGDEDGGKAPAGDASAQPEAEADAPSDDPGATALDEAEAARQRLLGHLESLGIEIAGLHGGLLEELSSMVYDSQLSRTLIEPEDSFNVSSVSVLGALALANVAYLRARSGDAELVATPLEVAERHVDRYRPGDLLFWDLAVRSAMAAIRADKGSGSAGVLTKLLLRILSHSVLAKLDAAFGLRLAALRGLDWRLWPGLATLVSHPGAASIRRHAVGRLALHCVKQQDKGALIAGRWMEALVSMPEERRLAGTLLAARFLWEALERDETAVASMGGRGPASGPFLAAVGRIEEARENPAPDDAESLPLYYGLVDIGSCLADYEAYQGLRTLARPMASVTIGAGTEAKGARE